MRRSDLDRVCRRGNGHDCDTETENESTNDQLRNTVCGSGNDHSEDDDHSTGEHSLSSTIPIGNDSSEWSSNH